METRQLAAFVAVVDRKSFSRAAEQLGLSQPAVSLQVAGLEKRVGTKLLDRSGRSVEPTEAGAILYRRAQRLLQLEEQLLDEIAGDDDELTGTVEIGASTGPGENVVPLLLCEFQRAHPAVHVSLSVWDTQTVVDHVARREVELGVVGASRRHRSVVLATPPGHPFAGRTIAVDELVAEPLIIMQEGAGVRLVIEDELRGIGTRLRDLDVRLELGLQESVKSAVLAGYGVSFIGRSAIEAELAAGSVAAARVEGLEPAREISLVRATGRPLTRAANAFVAFARERLAA